MKLSIASRPCVVRPIDCRCYVLRRVLSDNRHLCVSCEMRRAEELEGQTLRGKAKQKLRSVNWLKVCFYTIASIDLVIVAVQGMRSLFQ